jgi:acyl carrier protein
MTNTEPDTAAIESRVIAIIAEQEGLDASTVLLESKLEDLGMDSLDTLTFAISLEDEFDIQIAEDASRVTVGDLVTAVRAGLAAKK